MQRGAGAAVGSHNAMKKGIIGLVLPLLLVGVLAGCGNGKQDKESSSSSSEPSSSASVSSSQSEESTSGKATSTTKSAGSSSSSSSAATSGQVTQTSVLNAVANQMASQYNRQDIIMSTMQSNGIYTVQVQENHQSAGMKAKGADPSINPTVAWFQTNTKGQLLRSDNGGQSYYVVGNAY